MATPSKSKELAFNGRLRSNVDGASIGPNDFQVLKNLRYTDTNVRGVGGMTKINTSALASTGIRNGFHFRKAQPSEYHVLAWTSDGKVWVNNTAIPNQGAFDGTALFTDTAGGSTGRFSNAPGGALAYANGKEACLWGGTEHRCGGFIDYPTTGQIYDYSDLITNTKTDSNNVATIHTVQTTADSATMLLLHLDNNVTDSSPATPHTVTNNNVTFSSTYKKFGTYGGYWNGTNAYLSIPDNADFDFSGGVFTIDRWVYIPDDTVSIHPLYFQSTDANNYISLYLQRASIGGGGYCYFPTFVIYAASAEVVGISAANNAFVSGGWHHIEIVENGDSWYMFVDGNLGGNVTDTSRAANYTGTILTGYDGTNYFKGYMDEIRVSNSARHTSSFSPPSASYESSSSTSYIGSIMPLDGLKFYVVNPNAQSSTMSMSEWNGNSWSVLTIIADNTSSGGKTLAQTGTVTWASTASTSKPTQVEKLYLYWYKMVVTSSVDFSGTTLSQVTVSIPFQPIKDIWDGEERPLDSVMGSKSSVFSDFTSNVLENSYTSTGTTADASTYASLTGYTSSDYLYLGCMERLSGAMFSIIDDKVNILASIMSVSYWNGNAWTALTINDGTMNGTKTFGKSGWVTWSSPNRSLEFKRSDLGKNVAKKRTGNVFSGVVSPTVFGVKETPNMYYYRFSFSATLTNPVNIYHIAGIPAPKDIRGYSFPVMHQNRTVLACNMDGTKNTILMSAQDESNVFNGLDSYEYAIGQEEAINSAASLFLRFGSSVQDIILLGKQSEVHLLEGNGSDSDPYRVRLLSEKVGVRAPLTMTTVPVGDLGNGIRRQIAIWESQRGIEIFDGASLLDPLLSHDIKDKFDPMSSTYIGSSSNAGGYDPVYDEYHHIVPGVSEMAYSFIFKKWYEIDRGTGKRLYGCFNVMDVSGNSYLYGFGNDGIVYRLDNGPTFDGNAIVHTLRTGDMAFPEGSIMEYSQVQWFMLIAKAKTITAQNVAMVYYNDTASASYGTPTISPLRSGYRLINKIVQQMDLQTTFHGFEFSISTTDETIGFEPLYLGIRYTIFPRQLS